MVEYLTEQNSLSIKSLTDPCSGNDKLYISLYSELIEILNVGKRGEVKRSGYSTQFYFCVNLIFSNDGFLPNNFFQIYFKRPTWTGVLQFKTVFKSLN